MNKRNIPYGEIVSELVVKYPVRNPVWTYHPETNDFTAFASDLGLRKDPWNRLLTAKSHETFRDAEGDTTHWTYLTTVEGKHIELTVWND